MVPNFAPLTLPYELALLLQVDQSKVKNYFLNGSIYQWIEKDLLNHTLHICFPEAENIAYNYLNQWGFKTVRNRLATYYLQWHRQGVPPRQLDLDLLRPLLQLELDLERYTVNESSRLFLLLLYLEFQQRRPALEMLIPQLTQYLNLSGHKIWAIDQTILLLWHLHTFLPDYKELLQQRTPLRALMSRLGQVEKEQLLLNLIRYNQASNNCALFERELVV